LCGLKVLVVGCVGGSVLNLLSFGAFGMLGGVVDKPGGIANR